MRILLLHCYYQVRGGEDNVFEQEHRLLCNNNNVRIVKFINAAGFYGASMFLFSIWNFTAVRKVKKEIRNFKPDIIHIHNWHYSCGPVIIRLAKKLKVPVIITLHNYRLICPSGSLMNGNQLFTNSLFEGFPWSAVKFKVFRHSVLQTFWLAFVVWFHKKIGTWALVDKFIILTDFAKNIFISSQAGVLPAQLIVKPNFVEQPILKARTRKNYFLYIGRLSDEKGVNVLLSAFHNSNFQLLIAGDGPLLKKVKKVSQESSNIKYLGILDKSGVQKAMQSCSALIFPSIWYEGMPMTILEAFALGTPVIASNHGAMASMIQHGKNGLHFEPGNVELLRSTLIHWEALSTLERADFSHHATATYNKLYTAEANYQLLMDIYTDAINGNQLTSIASQKN